jgi:hypothetical protein
MVVIVTVTSRSEADVVAGVLDDSGIPNVIDADDAGGTNPEFDLTRFVKVLVREEDQQRARLVLAQARESGRELPSIFEVEPPTEPPAEP